MIQPLNLRGADLKVWRRAESAGRIKSRNGGTSLMKRRETPTLGALSMASKAGGVNGVGGTMTGTRRRRAAGLVLTLVVFLFQAAAPSPVAHADEEDDIQRQIDSQKANVPDLEKLDTQRAAAADIQRLRDWLAQAWDLRNRHEPDEARVVLDRCLSQAELVRQIIAASQAKAEVAAKEANLRKTREDIERKKKALQEALAKKRAMEQAQGS
jgi:hypothetical protein